MSLKALHVFLITVATVASLGFSAWCFQQHGGPAGFPGDLVIAIASGVGGLALVVYGVYFLKKLKHVSYL